MRRRVGAVVVSAAFLILPAAAQADTDLFSVDTTSDSGALTACTGAAADCSLRGAFANADDADTGDTDAIVFDAAIFDGVEAVPGEATIVLGTGLTSDEALNITVTCSTTQPCVGIDGPAGDNAISSFASLNMSGVAIFDSGVSGLFYGGITTGLSISNNWFGMKLDGTVDGNPIGVALSSGNAQIGGIGTTPNVFVGNEKGLQIFGGNGGDNVQGNLFGVKPNGTLAANTESDIDLRSNLANEGPQDILIGATPNDSTPACDDGCNVIASAGGPTSRGIEFTSQGTDAGTGDITIQGNHIGLNAAGTTSTGTGILVAAASGDGVTVIDNHLAGGGFGVTAGSAAEGLTILGNSIGTNAAETAVLDGTLAPSVFVNSAPSNPTLIQGNLIAKDPGNTQEAILIGNTGATVDENVIGIEGASGSGGQIGINATGSGHLIEENVIQETSDDAIALPGVINTEIAGNTIAGAIASDGIDMGGDSGNSTGNTIGGTDAARANTFEGVVGDAIRIRDDGQDQNQILVNLGSAGGLFVDLEGTDGPGNGATGPNAGIDAPKVKKVKKDEVTGTGVPGAEVWVYRSRSDKGDVPSGLKKFLGTKSVKNDGSWKFKPDKKLKGSHVITALQIDEIDNSSELSKGKKPK